MKFIIFIYNSQYYFIKMKFKKNNILIIKKKIIILKFAFVSLIKIIFSLIIFLIIFT